MGTLRQLRKVKRKLTVIKQNLHKGHNLTVQDREIVCNSIFREFISSNSESDSVISEPQVDILCKKYRDAITLCKFRIQKGIESDLLGSEHYWGEIFQNSRKRFYERFFRSGDSDLRGPVSQIYDSSTGEVITDPGGVKRVIANEAAKLFQKGKLKPNNFEFERYYVFNQKGLDTRIWNPLTEAFTITELRDALKCEGEKSPGMDRITKELLLLAMSDLNSRRSSFVVLLCNLLNRWYFLGNCPDSNTLGRVVLIPKKGRADSAKYIDKRPLTMLSEISKLPRKVLTVRLQNILLKYPEVLHSAQGGFIKGGLLIF